MTNKKLFKVKKADFINWYFEDEKVGELFPKHRIVDALIEEGKFVIDVQELFDGCETIPSNLIHEFNGEEDWYMNTSKCELI